MDLVYFYRHVHPHETARATDELRYSLRTMVENYGALGEVHVFGGRAPWFSSHVNHYPVRQGYTKHENTHRIWRHIASAAATGYLPDEFLIMNDDFFLMCPLDHVPHYVSGTLDAWIAQRHLSSNIVETVDRTRAMIAALGGPPAAELLGFERHVPLVVHGPTLARIWPGVDEWTRGGRGTHVIAKRSAYGNLAGISDVEVMPDDCKIINTGDPIPTGPWVSTSDDAFMLRNTHPIGQQIRMTYARATRFEAPAGATIPGVRTVRSDTPLRRVAPR